MAGSLVKLSLWNILLLNVEIRDCFEVIGFMIASHCLRPKFRRGGEYYMSTGNAKCCKLASSLFALTCQTYKCSRTEKSSKLYQQQNLKCDEKRLYKIRFCVRSQFLQRTPFRFPVGEQSFQMFTSISMLKSYIFTLAHQYRKLISIE